VGLKEWLPVIGEISLQLNRTMYLYRNSNVCPNRQNLFRTFELTSPEDIHVVILGQDPYHSLNKKGEPIADGLAFSVNNDTPSSSLNSIFTELRRSGVASKFVTNQLDQWCSQGVLLLNVCLISKVGLAKQYRDIGWSVVTRNVLSYLTSDNRPVCFMLWGKDAYSCTVYMNKDVRNKYVLCASHPSGLSAHKSSGIFPPFIGCNHFASCNTFLESQDLNSIDWNLY
jgi:uracil-DNA glycosylase